jgi:Transposase
MNTRSYPAPSSIRRCWRLGSLTWTATDCWTWSRAAPRKGFRLAGRPPGAVAGRHRHRHLGSHAGYARGLADGLPHAELGVDHFHAVRLANAGLDETRRRVQQEALGHRGRQGDPLYRIRRQLLVAHERLTEGGWARIQAGLAAGDPAGEVGAAYLAKELFREVYPPPLSGRLAGGSSISAPTVATPRSSSFADSPPRCAAGSTRSWAGIARGSPTGQPKR